MSLFICTMLPFDYDIRDKSKKWEARSDIRERRLLLKVERHLVQWRALSPIKLFWMTMP